MGRRESTRRSERVMKANLLLSTARLRVLTMSSPAKRKCRWEHKKSATSLLEQASWRQSDITISRSQHSSPATSATVNTANYGYAQGGGTATPSSLHLPGLSSLPRGGHFWRKFIIKYESRDETWDPCNYTAWEEDDCDQSGRRSVQKSTNFLPYIFRVALHNVHIYAYSYLNRMKINIWISHISVRRKKCTKMPIVNSINLAFPWGCQEMKGAIIYH